MRALIRKLFRVTSKCDEIDNEIVFNTQFKKKVSGHFKKENTKRVVGSNANSDPRSEEKSKTKYCILVPRCHSSF